MKKPKLWIYEYKDDDTPIGTTIVKEFIDDLDEEIKLPHLSSDWHYRVQLLMEDDEEEE